MFVSSRRLDTCALRKKNTNATNLPLAVQTHDGNTHVALVTHPEYSGETHDLSIKPEYHLSILGVLSKLTTVILRFDILLGHYSRPY